MLDESNYVRQELELSAPKEPLTMREIVWLDEAIPNAASAGIVDGSLIVVGPLFLGCEDPMADNRVVAPAEEVWPANDADAMLTGCNAELQPWQTDVAQFRDRCGAPGQLRRAFLYYLERERAHPYRPFLHYNSWYDIAWQPFALNGPTAWQPSSCSASG